MSLWKSSLISRTAYLWASFKSFDHRKIFEETVGRINFLQNLFHRLLWNKLNDEYYCSAIWFQVFYSDSCLLYIYIYISLFCFMKGSSMPWWRGQTYELLTSDVWIVELTLESPGGYGHVPVKLLFQQFSNHLAMLLESIELP